VPIILKIPTSSGRSYPKWRHPEAVFLRRTAALGCGNSAGNEGESSVDEDRGGTIRLVVVGCFLICAYSGCCPIQPRRCAPLPDDCSSKCAPACKLNDRPRDCEETLPLCEVSGEDSAVQADAEACEAAPMSCEVSCGPDDGVPCEAPVLGIWQRLCVACRCPGLPAKEMVETAYYRHPRFHPVPTRPVFSRRIDFPGPVGVTPPEDGPAPIHMTPPAPVPEEIRTPRPQSDEIGVPRSESQQPDRITQVPRRLPPVPRSSSWLLNQSPTSPSGPELQAQSKPSGQSIKR